MTRTSVMSLLACTTLCVSTLAQSPPEIGGPQNTFESRIDSVVRNKRYYKKGTVELGVYGGVLPYDSLVNHSVLGGRLTWHLSDHYGWEVIDYVMPFSSVTGFTRSFVSDSERRISNLQALHLKSMVGTNLLLSPFYGKIRFFGAQVMYLDIYVVVGGGMINTQTMRYSWDGAGGMNSVQLNDGWDPALNFGVGFKFFATRAFTLFIDLRNYMSHSLTYGNRSIHSHFTASGGISLFLPPLG